MKMYPSIEALQLNEANFIVDCAKFYSGTCPVNPAVSNMTGYSIPADRAIVLMDHAKAGRYHVNNNGTVELTI